MRANQLAIVCVLALTIGQAHASFIIDMEGIAPHANTTDENNSTRTFGAYEVFIRHGHFWDSAINLHLVRPSNETDWLMNDDVSGIDITRSDGGTFSVTSLDVSEYDASFGGSNDFQAIGFFSGGGSITHTFTTDTDFLFQTISLAGLGFDNLTVFRLIDSDGEMAFDNIQAGAVAIPEPASLTLFGIGVAFAAVRRRGATRTATL